jgi:hypothetical protein
MPPTLPEAQPEDRQETKGSVLKAQEIVARSNCAASGGPPFPGRQDHSTIGMIRKGDLAAQFGMLIFNIWNGLYPGLTNHRIGLLAHRDWLN